jgi:hypothetical protein
MQMVLLTHSGSVAVQAERPDPGGGAALVRLLEPGMRHHQPPAVEHATRTLRPCSFVASFAS